MRTRIVVAHAGRQHSHQLAAALHARGMLHEYWTGLPMKHSSLQPAAAYPEVELPIERVRVMSVGAAAHYVERWIRPGTGEALLGQLGDYFTDRVYAHWLRNAPADVAAVVGYENGSLAMFTAARERGLRTILDAASVHHAAADRWLGVPAARGWARDVRVHKDDELALADHVLVLSELARETYVAAGVPPQRISVVPLGYDPAVFQAAGDPCLAAPLRFVFVGNAGHRKAFDVLLDAASRVARAGIGLRLVVIGDVDARDAPGVELRGKLPQAAIAAEFARADCLILPSRCDAFGMVVAEALGSGLAAIVSEHVGAKALVAESGAGWIVPASDAAALAERMRRCVEHPQEVLDAKRRARAAAAGLTWERYRVRVADTVLGVVAHG